MTRFDVLGPHKAALKSIEANIEAIDGGTFDGTMAIGTSFDDDRGHGVTLQGALRDRFAHQLVGERRGLRRLPEAGRLPGEGQVGAEQRGPDREA